MGRRRSSSIAGSPLLIGAVTTLIAVVAVYLSYNANNGLPFVPTYSIKVELPQASGLQDQNQVRLGGTRVGTVSSLSPHENPRTGQVTAIATLKLEKKVEPLPANTTAAVQSVSTIGLKYLELKRGNSAATIKAGHTLPISQTREPVNIEELFNMFDKPTRTAIKVNTNNFGDGLAGRGTGLNQVIHELPPARDLRRAGAAQPGVSADRAARALRGPQPGLRTGGPGGPAAGQLLHLPGQILHRLGERGPLDRRSQHRRPALAGTGDLLAAPRGGVLRKRDQVHEPAAPQRQVARESRHPNWATPSASAPPTSRRPPSSTTPCSNPPRRWRNSPRTRSPRWGSKNSPTRSKSPTRCSRA